jgi:hypothetical protein
MMTETPPQKEKIIGISCAANRDYVRRLNQLGRKYGVKYGVLVRQAIDEKFGNELETIDLFFAQRGK